MIKAAVTLNIITYMSTDHKSRLLIVNNCFKTGFESLKMVTRADPGSTKRHDEAACSKHLNGSDALKT